MKPTHVTPTRFTSPCGRQALSSEAGVYGSPGNKHRDGVIGTHPERTGVAVAGELLGRQQRQPAPGDPDGERRWQEAA